MNTPLGNQSIRCSVKSCTYHAQDHDICDLKSIHVAARPGGNDGCPEGESMCASYHHE